MPFHNISDLCLLYIKKLLIPSVGLGIIRYILCVVCWKGLVSSNERGRNISTGNGEAG